MDFIQTLRSHLSKLQKIAIVIHQNPDGDAIGSGIGLATFLKQKGHDVTLITPDSIPAFLAWIPGIEMLHNFEEEQELVKKAISHADLILCLDFPVLHRAGGVAPLIEEAQGMKMAIDHHPDHQNFAHHMWIDTHAAATAILVYRLIRDLEGCDLINTQIATCLYVGIQTDTGSFQYTNTSDEAHLVAGDLIKRGVNLPLIREHINPRKPLSRIRLFSYMFLKRLVYMPEHHAAYLLLSQADYHKFKLQPGDTSGLASQALEIDEVLLAVLLVEKVDKIHLSFRSVDPVPVNHFAQKYFQGGGHLHAAGGCAYDSLENTAEKVKKAIIKEMPHYLKPKK